MTEADDAAAILDEFRSFDAYTLGDAARDAGTGNILQHLKPQTRDSRFVGRALPARIWREQFKSVPVKQYGSADLREQARPGDVVVLDGGGMMLSAMGDLAFANLKLKGAAGAVVNACVRDVEQLEELELGLPVFSLGAAIASVAGNSRVVDIRQPVYIQGVRICHGDLIAGCRGGIVVIPWEDRHAVLEQARRIANTDRLVRDGLQRGESITSLWQQHK